MLTQSKELLVAPVKDTGEAPVWVGELPPVPIEVAMEVGKLRRSAATAIGAMEAKKGDLDFENYPLSEVARADLLNAVTEHIDATENLPTDTTLTIEKSRDNAVVLNTCRGSRIKRDSSTYPGYGFYAGRQDGNYSGRPLSYCIPSSRNYGCSCY